jgi:hypothetical protein
MARFIVEAGYFSWAFVEAKLVKQIDSAGVGGSAGIARRQGWHSLEQELQSQELEL